MEKQDARKGPTIQLLRGGGGWAILKKNILQVHMHKKKIAAQDHRAKKNSCTYSGLEKNSGKMFPELTHWTLSIGRLLNDLSIWAWVLIKEGFVAQYCVCLGCLYLYINSTRDFQYSYIIFFVEFRSRLALELKKEMF